MMPGQMIPGQMKPGQMSGPMYGPPQIEEVSRGIAAPPEPGPDTSHLGKPTGQGQKIVEKPVEKTFVPPWVHSYFIKMYEVPEHRAKKKMDFDEWCACLAVEKDVSAKRVFRFFDGNESGYVRISEMTFRFTADFNASPHSLVSWEPSNQAKSKSHALTQREVKMYFKRFNEQDKDGSGCLDYDEFLFVLEQPGSDHTVSAFGFFDLDGSGEIGLREFVVGLQFLTDQHPKKKLKFAFQIFDGDNNAELNHHELRTMIDLAMRAAAHEPPSVKQVELRVDQIYAELGIPDSTGITFEKFVSLADDPRTSEMIAPLPTFSNSLLLNIMKPHNTNPLRANPGKFG